jgi:subtilisin family serine protease
MQKREYVITLHSKDDLDGFYDDMETPGGNLYIPYRAIPVHHRRAISKNTHYMLTDAEAEQIRSDSRVANVVLSMEEQGIHFSPIWIQTSSLWNKSGTTSAAHLNWGNLRCFEGTQRPNWGSNGTTNQSGTARGTLSGKNVDVVIVDGMINPAHPEFAVNPNGTGGSRVIQYNWFQHNEELGVGSNSTYIYTPYVDPTYPDNNENGISDRTEDNDHGCHVAGTACGNTFGWARDANIYNISPYGTAPSYNSRFIDYIRAWHTNKPINPETGIRNPTITNHSYGITRGRLISDVIQVAYRGEVYEGPFTASQLNSYGIRTRVTEDGIFALFNDIFEPYAVDVQEAIDDGIIFVGAAANDSTKISTPSDPTGDYFNSITVLEFGFFLTNYNYMRGTSGAVDGMICVGAVSALVNESKATFSNCGPRIDVYAPGSSIMSSLNSTSGIADARNTSFHNVKYSGTSMASPQVCGVLACVLETWPRMTSADALAYIYQTAKLGQMASGNGGPTDNTDLQGSVNRYLAQQLERPYEGLVGPKSDFGLRPTTGQTWPRTKIYRYGS